MKQPDLGKKIAALRQQKNLTQDELVEKCNVNVRTIPLTGLSPDRPFLFSIHNYLIT